MPEEALGISIVPGIDFVGGGWMRVAFEGFEIERWWVVLAVGFDTPGQLVDAFVYQFEAVG
jgi:hypothetical protein